MAPPCTIRGGPSYRQARDLFKRYRSLSALLEDVRRGEIPTSAVSLGYAASVLKITRQAVSQRVEHGTLRGWKAGRVVLIELPGVARGKPIV